MGKSRIRIGLSGWTYPPWRGGFYPKGLRQADELAYAASRFDALEINSTFYGLKRPDTFKRWRDSVPEGFPLAVKAPKYITHDLRLAHAATPLANFLASGLLALGSSLGPILWQLPPSLAFDEGRMEAFLALLPQTDEEALALAKAHDDHVAGHVFLDPVGLGPIRHAIEVRHESFRVPAFIRLLRRFNVALVIADAPTFPLIVDRTADFIYVRLHGDKELYVSGYDETALDCWSARLDAWAESEEHDPQRLISAPTSRQRLPPTDIFVFFDNTLREHRAPVDALMLKGKMMKDL
ncbi:hypothetical protein BJF93_04445 [Xaviernesmea oryzae]|uniref:DUF72 domain-containing protein n=1 Tax=Xaviernesmea oryzae TaxID=464029 RepID=A0A1Q9AUP7_9HYPH|nr:DUF72 domain-containing protein [Xaviernesmea oryzae]OLP59162.1 hypothetical protein BJF93_04445 [Xaviernesmea oryzae]SEK83758.1 Uncharacterized conserved protein YecE, DUF72 family [Xaviernesmea oryzae]